MRSSMLIRLRGSKLNFRGSVFFFYKKNLAIAMALSCGLRLCFLSFESGIGI